MSVTRVGLSMCRLATGKLLRGMLAHPFEGRPRYPTPSGCGGDSRYPAHTDPASRLSGGTLTHLYAARVRLFNFARTMVLDEAAASWDATPMARGGRRACPTRAADAQGASQLLPPRSPSGHDHAGRG